MTNEVRLYIGTNSGVLSTRSSGDAWTAPEPSLPNVFSRGLVACPSDARRVYAAAGKDGLFRTEDRGAHWARVFDGHVRALTIHPTDDDVVYVGTEPVHLYRSDDRGDTWEELTGLLAMPEEVKANWWFPQPPHLGHIAHIYVHSDDPDIMYLSIEHGGIARSTDGGRTWEDVSSGIDYLDIHQVGTLPHRLDRYYASTAQGFFTSQDPAKGWVRSEQGFTRDYFHDFIFLPPPSAAGLPTMLISTADKSPGSWDRPGHARGALFRSLDCGQSWRRVDRGLPDELEENVWAVCPHPTDPAGAFIGLGKARTPGSTTPGQVLATRDRGESWDRIGLQLPLVLSLLAVGE